jgi:replicative DNA helicase
MTEQRKLPDDFLEKLIVKGMCVDNHFVAALSSVFKPNYFEDSRISKIFSFTKEYFQEYNKLPPRDVVVANYGDNGNEIREIYDEIDSIDYDVADHYDYLFHETNLYLKEQALKEAIMKGVDIVEKKGNPLEYKDIVEDAMTKDMNIDLGINYWQDLNERLKRILSQRDVRVPSNFPILDEFISGGFPTYTLSIFMSRIHGFKSNFLVNTASRQVLKGYNPIILSMEMSEDSLCQRLDSIYSLQDINRIYVDKKTSRKMLKELRSIKENNGLGNLIVKEFPTGSATISDFDTFIRELNYRGIKPGPIYCDYLQIMKNEKSGNKNQRHDDLRQIAESLRALSLKHQTPAISVSQLNREGMFSDFDEVDFTHVAEGISISATADFMAIFGKNEDSLVYESELHYKIVKNRLGGRVGEIGKLYIDKKTLKMYDESELDQWISDAKISGDERKIHKQER